MVKVIAALLASRDAFSVSITFHDGAILDDQGVVDVDQAGIAVGDGGCVPWSAVRFVQIHQEK